MFVRSYKDNRPYVMLSENECNLDSIKKIIKTAKDKGYSGITLNTVSMDPDYDKGMYDTMSRIASKSVPYTDCNGFVTQRVKFNKKTKRKEYGGYRYQMRFQFADNIALGLEAEKNNQPSQGRSL